MTRKTLDETVNHPSHYNFGKIEVIEFIEDQTLGYHLGNAVKYICRAGRKDPGNAQKYLEDLEKAVWYLRRRIEITSHETPRRPNEMPNPLVEANDSSHSLKVEANDSSHSLKNDRVETRQTGPAGQEEPRPLQGL